MPDVVSSRDPPKCFLYVTHLRGLTVQELASCLIRPNPLPAFRITPQPTSFLPGTGYGCTDRPSTSIYRQCIATVSHPAELFVVVDAATPVCLAFARQILIVSKYRTLSFLLLSRSKQQMASSTTLEFFGGYSPVLSMLCVKKCEIESYQWKNASSQAFAPRTRPSPIHCRKQDIYKPVLTKVTGTTTFRLRIAGLTILHDTWFAKPALFHRYLELESLTEVDYIVISHAHFDQ
jgi:hypothetical protein